jgi:hypothetical protein
VQSTKFEFVINLQTARTLGIEVPNSMQLLADELIERGTLAAVHESGVGTTQTSRSRLDMSVHWGEAVKVTPRSKWRY